MKTNDGFIRELLIGNKIPAEETVRAKFLSEQAEIVFKSILDIASDGKTASLPVKLCICDTYDTFSYMAPVESKGGKIEYYLVLDQHMNTVNTVINAIFFSQGDSSHDIEKLTYTLCLEDSIAAKDGFLRDYFERHKRILGKYNCKDELFTDINRFYVLVQMTFIIGHEIGHFICSPTGKELQLEYGDVTVKTESMISAMLNKVNSYLETETNPKVLNELLNEKNTLLSDIFAGEYAADAIGAAVAYSFAHNVYVKNEDYRQFDGEIFRDTILTAIIIAMLNIEVVSVLKKGDSFESFYRHVLSRIALIADFFENIGVKETAPIFDELQEFMERYNTRILSPLIDSIRKITG